jgi:hypothetical protein
MYRKVPVTVYGEYDDTSPQEGSETSTNDEKLNNIKSVDLFI